MALRKDNGYTTTLNRCNSSEKKLLKRRAVALTFTGGDPKEQTQQQVAGDLLKRAFDNSARSLVMGALAAQPSTQVDIRKMLDDYTKKADR